ncbi:RHS repeat domain-containing protein [Chryseobacterium vaccae]|uniref:hypothetical protein n=1 Tax=Chryseobacterium vaccae TaxID=2604424 RepID=UPI001294EE53|nr:hypothetical protein [Chryseobacterium vaccae]
MKKTNYIKALGLVPVFLGALFYGQAGIGQSTGSAPKQILSFPTSPDAYSFGKVDNIPVDYFKGQVNIDIPIYTIQVDGLSIPISLKYNTGGVKQNEIASSAGLGWSLSIPNRVMRSIEGMDDEKAGIYFKNYTEAHNYYSNSPYDLSDNASDLFYNNLIDSKPDLYSYSLPGAGGSFIVNAGKGYTIPHEDLKISADISSINVTDNKGNIFALSPKNMVMSRRLGSFAETSSNLYLLDNLKTYKNNIISFEYNKNQGYIEKTKYETKNLLKNVVIPYYVYEDGFMEENPPSVQSTENNAEQLITKITFQDGEVNFLYSGDQGEMTTDDSQFRKDLNSNTGAVALKRIIVKNKAGKIIRDFSFIYSYFESDSNVKTHVDYRLKLHRVKNNLENNFYEFTYNDGYALPPRNGNSDDYWGYFNSTMVSNTSIPRYVDGISAYSISNIPTGRDRYTNSLYAQMGVLTKIKYPTGGERKLEYESNSVVTTSVGLFPQISYVTTLISDYMEVENPANQYYETKEMFHTFTPADFQDKMNVKIKVGFANGCYNGINDTSGFPPVGMDPDYEGPLGSCTGSWSVQGQGGKTMSRNGVQYDIIPTLTPIKLTLRRVNECSCSVSISMTYDQMITNNTEKPVGGLRIKQIEDVDASNVSNTRRFLYNSSGALRRKFHFSSPFYRILRPDPAIPEMSGNDVIVENFRISSSGNSYISYNSSDIVTYSKVTEQNDLGEVDHFFTNASEGGTSIFAMNSDPYNEWKMGLPIKTVIRKGSAVLKEQSSTYAFSNIKNSLSGYVPETADEIAFGADFDIVKFHSHSPNVTVPALQLFNYNPIKIYGGKVELKQTREKEYFQNNKTIETVTDYNYSDTNINSPINLISQKTQLADGTTQESIYKYAYEKGNQRLITANQISTPLETEMKKNNKTVSRAETLYNDPSHLFPSSVQSLDIQTNTLATDASYDKYDTKGNPLQYTTKDGISTAIIWGYNSTQPIAKIEGIKYTDIPSSLVTGIITSSDNDNIPPQGVSAEQAELNLLAALDSFRTHASLSGYQITTYSYDPLIGVKSITPPSGIREVYLYDTANRLKEVREHNPSGRIIKEYQYHYKN